MGQPWGGRQGSEQLKAILSDWPMDRPRNWVSGSMSRCTAKDAEGVQTCIARNRPFGERGVARAAGPAMGSVAHLARLKGGRR